MSNQCLNKVYLSKIASACKNFWRESCARKKHKEIFILNIAETLQE